MAHIPTFYRIWFTYLDPLIALHATYMNYVTPGFVLNSQIAGAPFDPDYYPFFQQLGGFLASTAFLSAVLLRATAELRLWKILQAAVLIVDASLLGSIYTSLRHQSRLRPTDWHGLARRGLGLRGHYGVLDRTADVLLAGAGVCEDGRSCKAGLGGLVDHVCSAHGAVRAV